MLGDITCDSDGKIDQFIDRRDVKRTLALHPFTGEPYYLGVFLVGAYQEILGDLHNLFGDTHAVHVSLDPTGNVVLESVIKGDTVPRSARLRRVRRRYRSCASCAIRSRPPSAKAGSTSRSPAACSASTKTACTAIPTWKIPASSDGAMAGLAAEAG